MDEVRRTRRAWSSRRGFSRLVKRWRSALTGGRGTSLSLALQGGGSHGAFTWGVLDRLLEEKDLHIEGVSGASAGAMNAAVFATGYQSGGRRGAQAALAAFWQEVSDMARLSPLQPTPLDRLFGSWNRDWSPGYLLFRTLAKLTSPYQLNPTGFNPLIPLIRRHVDFSLLRQGELKLFIAVTNVRTGMLRVISNSELTAEALAASACLPLVFPAVELEGHHYWDGGYSANPPLLPLIQECSSRDILMVQLSPIHAPNVPRNLADIVERTHELSFNAGFLRELQLLAALRLGERSLFGGLRRQLRRVNLHQVHTAGELAAFGKASRINSEWPFLEMLRDMGRRRADEWLGTVRQDLGRRSSVAWEEFA